MSKPVGEELKSDRESESNVSDDGSFFGTLLKSIEAKSMCPLVLLCRRGFEANSCAMN